MLLTPEVSHAPMSSLKDAAAELQELEDAPQNKSHMVVTRDVSHVEMWPYAASAAALSESQRATAVLMLSLSSAVPATASNKLKTHRSAAGPIIVAGAAVSRGGAARARAKAAQSSGWSWQDPSSETSSAGRKPRKETTPAGH